MYIQERTDFESAEGRPLGYLAGLLPRGCSLPEHLELNRLATIWGLLPKQMMCPDDTRAGHGPIPVPTGPYRVSQHRKEAAAWRRRPPEQQKQCLAGLPLWEAGRAGPGHRGGDG